MIKWEIPCALTIAGSDSSGGAGVEADLKTFAALNVYGACAVTAVTIQNTRGVYGIHPITAKNVQRQIEVILDDISIKSAKTGMLYTKETVEIVAKIMGKRKIPLVVDPVFRAGSGNLLIKNDAKSSSVKKLIPEALVVTPNIFEAEDISGIKIKNIDDMKKAGKIISKLGSEAVIIKGGHLGSGTIIDFLYYSGKSKYYAKSRAEMNMHGAGCTFSAAITAFLAHGYDLVRSVDKAELFMLDAVTHSLGIGKGRRPVNQFATIYRELDRPTIVDDLHSAIKMIESHPEFLPHIANVGTQVAMALPYASNFGQVAAVEGRIKKAANKPKAMGPVKFGVSTHMASVALTVMRYDPNIRAALNLHYTPKLVETFKNVGFTVTSFDRKKEPMRVKTIEGGTLAWGTNQAIRKLGKVPDIIFDVGEPRKEPMIRVLGASATDVVTKVLRALR